MTSEVVPLNRDRTVPQTVDLVTAIGMGRLASGGSELATVLRDVDLFTLSDLDCVNAYPTEQVVTDVMLCATARGRDS